MIERYRDGVIPEGREDPALCAGDDALEGIDGVVRELLDRFELTAGAGGDLDPGAAAEPLRRGDASPGSWPRTTSQAERLDSVLYNLAEGIRVLALLLHPYMPETSGRLLEALAEGNRELDAFGARGGGARVERIAPLFPKLD